VDVTKVPRLHRVNPLTTANAGRLPGRDVGRERLPNLPVRPAISGFLIHRFTLCFSLRGEGRSEARMSVEVGLVAVPRQSPDGGVIRVTRRFAHGSGMASGCPVPGSCTRGS